MKPQYQTTSSEPPARRNPRVFYGWYIVAASTIHGFLSFGIFQIGLSVFIKDIRDTFGWSLTAISFGFSIKQFETGILGPAGGYLVDRFGPRITGIFGTVIMTIGLLIFANMHSIQEFFISSMVIALGQGIGAGMAFTAPIMFWFRRKRGLASSIAAMGRGWGYALALPITFLLVHFGWRESASIAAITYAVIGIPCALVLRRQPEPYGYLPDGMPIPPPSSHQPDTHQHHENDSDFTVGQALHTRSFWLLLVANLLFSFTGQSNHVHLINHLRTTGFAPQSAALVVTIYGIVQVLGRPIAGIVGDRMGRHRLYMISNILMGVGWVAIAFVTPSNWMWIISLYYLTYGLGQGAHAVIQQTIVADFFGPRRYATLRGIVNLISVLGGVLGPLSTGVMFDAFGSYRTPFMLMAPIAATGALSILLAGKPKLAGVPATAKV